MPALIANTVTTTNTVTNTTFSGYLLDSRERLTSPRTYYLRPDGSDSNDGLGNTSGGAWRTPQKAMNVIGKTLDLAENVTVKIADGTYDALYVGKTVGSGFVTWEGNQASPNNVIFSHTNSPAGPVLDVENDCSAPHWFKGIKFQNSSNSASGERRVVYIGRRNLIELIDCHYETNTGDGRLLFADDFSVVTVNGNSVFTSEGSGDAQIVADHSNLTVWGNLTINGLGGMTSHVRAQSLGRIEYYPSNVTINGSPSIYCFALATGGMAYIEAAYTTFTGSVSGYRAIAEKFSFIDTLTSSITYFPGSISPFVQQGGAYCYNNGTMLS